MKKIVENFLYEDLTYKIRCCAFRVYNTLGFGHKENIYQEALASEFQKEQINFEREKALTILYNNKKIGVYRPDFVVDGKVILEIKAVPIIPKDYETQLVYYLKSTDFKLGLLINFGARHLEIRRRIWSSHYQR